MDVLSKVGKVMPPPRPRQTRGPHLASLLRNACTHAKEEKSEKFSKPPGNGSEAATGMHCSAAQLQFKVEPGSILGLDLYLIFKEIFVRSLCLQQQRPEIIAQPARTISKIGLDFEEQQHVVREREREANPSTHPSFPL